MGQRGERHIAHDLQALRTNAKLLETDVCQSDIDCTENNIITIHQLTSARVEKDSNAINKWNPK